MHLVRVAAGVLLLAAHAAGQSTPKLNSSAITTLLAGTPACAMPCFAQGLQAGNCTMAGLTDCVCTNIPLQAGVSACVQTSCIFDQQVATAEISQQLCRGYPIPERRRFSKVFSIVLPSISTATVALRCVARWTVTNQLWWDDWTALMGLFFLIVTAVLGYYNAGLGFGIHYWDVEPGKGKTILQIFYVLQMLYIFVLISAKSSICCFYSRVFTNNKRFRRVTTGVMVFLLTHGLMFFFLVTFQCLPIVAIWNRRIEGRCLDYAALGYGGAAVSIFEDLILFIIPIPELMKLQLCRKKKLALVFMFSVASFACIASMIRLKYMVSYANTYDATWDNVDIVLWSSIELNAAIICGSLPALRPLFKKIPGILTTVKTTLQSGYHRNSRDLSGTANSNASHHSIALSSEASPRKPIQPRKFGSGSTAKDTHVTTDTRVDATSTDGSERHEWMDKSTLC